MEISSEEQSVPENESEDRGAKESLGGPKLNLPQHLEYKVENGETKMLDEGSEDIAACIVKPIGKSLEQHFKAIGLYEIQPFRDLLDCFVRVIVDAIRDDSS